MKSFLHFLHENNYVITEELHPELSNILNSPIPPEHKLSLVSKKIRELSNRNEDIGLENSKPKKGSSRAVYFPKEPRNIILDGEPTKIKTVVKIAFPGQLDKYRKHGERLLGEEQNSVEGDQFSSNTYGMLRHEHDKGFMTNHRGILVPVIHSHHDDHYLEVGHVDKINKSKFKQLTKTPEFKKGLDFDDMYRSLLKEHAEAHGKRPLFHVEDDKHDEIMNHPFVEHYHSFMLNTGNHPGDINLGNMGVWKHPHTGKEHVVISDYGYSDNIAKMYHELRNRHMQKHRGY